MSYYMIGIGGSGAKCVEAFTHLCASGMMTENEKMKNDVYVIFVDPDRSNGSLERSQVTLGDYQNCRQELVLGRTDLFKTNISFANPNVWSPFLNEARPRLDHFFQYHLLREQNQAAANFFDVLYSNEEKETPLDMGFRGHPSIGAAIFAKTIKLHEVEPWQTFRMKLQADVQNNERAKIFLFGSIFGGTGASGFPTIAKLIHQELSKSGQEFKYNIGGCLLLPYFQFLPEGKDKDIRFRANAENFIMTTQVGLKYYSNQKYDKQFDSIYLLGNDKLTMVQKFGIGAKKQKNEPHFIELYAALAALDFFKREEYIKYPMIARLSADKMEWADLPDENQGNLIRSKIRQLARFAFAYLSVYYPMLQDIKINGKSHRAPWFVEFFERREEQLRDEPVETVLEHVQLYCKSFLLWLSNIEKSIGFSTPQLVDYQPFATLEIDQEKKEYLALREEFQLSDFENIIMPRGEEKPKALSYIWEKLSDYKMTKEIRDAKGVGRFIHALFEACGGLD